MNSDGKGSALIRLKAAAALGANRKHDGTLP